MAMQSLLAKAGLRSLTLGLSTSLAIAAPLAEGNPDPAAHTHANRIGVYFDRTSSAEKMGVVVMGVEKLSVGVSLATVSTALTAAGVVTQGSAPNSPITTGFQTMGSDANLVAVFKGENDESKTRVTVTCSGLTGGSFGPNNVVIEASGTTTHDLVLSSYTGHIRFWTAARTSAGYIDQTSGVLNWAKAVVATDTVLAASDALTGSVLSLAQTWNTTGGPTAIKLVVTNTASTAESYLLDLQVGSTSMFRVRKDGAFAWRSPSATHALVTAPFSSTSWGMTYNSTANNGCVFAVANLAPTGVTFALGNAYSLSWCALSGTNLPTVALVRDGANGCLAQRVTTAAQVFRVYNTAGTASNDTTNPPVNYERGVLDWQTTSTVLTIGTQAAGTGTLRGMVLAAAGTTIVNAGTSAAKTLIVKVFAGQTANLQEWQDSSAGTLASVSYEGAFNIALANAVATSTALTSAVSYSGSVTSASQLVGANISGNWSSSGTLTTGLLHGMIVSAVAGANGVTTAYGVKLVSGSYNGATLTTSYSLHATMRNQTAGGGGGAITTAYGVYVLPDLQLNSATTTAYSLYLDSPTVAATITNEYAIYQASVTARNYFAGVVHCNTYFRNTPQEVTVAATTTAITSGRVKAMGTTAGQTLTLPAGVAGTDVFIRNAASVSVTIAVTDGTVEGASTLTLNAGESAMFTRVGTDWTVFN